MINKAFDKPIPWVKGKSIVVIASLSLPDSRTDAEIQEDIDFAKEFIATVDADPILQGDGARTERLKMQLDQEELERRHPVR